MVLVVLVVLVVMVVMVVMVVLGVLVVVLVVVTVVLGPLRQSIGGDGERVLTTVMDGCACVEVDALECSPAGITTCTDNAHYCPLSMRGPLV